MADVVTAVSTPVLPTGRKPPLPSTLPVMFMA